jgi:YD repeat-containing protein
VPTANVSYDYDDFFSRKISMTDGTGMTQYQYYPVGSLGALQLQQSDGAYTNDTIAYQYDALGRVTMRTIDTTNDTFSYDTLGRITNHTSPLGAFVTSYLGDTDQQTSEHKQNPPNISMGTDWQYDSNLKDRHLLNITHSAGKNFNYTTSAENNITAIHETSSSSTNTTRDWQFNYDANDRLLQTTVPNNVIYRHQYDPLNNILNSNYSPVGGNSTSSEPFNYNNLNQVLTNSLYGRVANYDANGNMTTFHHTGGRSQNYTWDAENRLVKITPYTPLSTYTASIQYDGVGRFTKITDDLTSFGGGITEHRFLWCGDELCQVRDAQDNVQKHFYSEGTHSLITNQEST